MRSYAPCTFSTPRYQTTHHERDQATGYDNRGARLYDAEIARFLGVDPLAGMFASWSSYNYVMGNPIILVDPTGRNPEDSDAAEKDENGWTAANRDLANRFGTFGGGAGSENLGDYGKGGPDDDFIFDKGGRFIRRVKNNSPDRVGVEDSGTTTYYDLHDGAVSRGGFDFFQGVYGKYFGQVQFLFPTDNASINEMMSESGVYKRNYVSRRLKAYMSSDGGSMDFSVYHLLEGPVKSLGTKHYTFDNASNDNSAWFLMPDEKVYNHFDAGNWLWGNAMRRLGFSQDDAVYYAKQYNSDDSSADIQAIISGYNN